MYLKDIGDRFKIRKNVREDLAGDSGGCDPPDGFARRSAAAALPVTNAIFCFIGEVGMGGTERFLQRKIVLRPSVLISNQNCDRRAQGMSFENSGKNFAAVRFLARADERALTRPPSIELALDVGFA